METEDVYSAVLRLFQSCSFEKRWRIIVESDIRIILEKNFDVDSIADPKLELDQSNSTRSKKRGRPRKLLKAEPPSALSRNCHNSPHPLVKCEVVLENLFPAVPPLTEWEDFRCKIETDAADVADSGGEWGSGRSKSSPETPLTNTAKIRKRGRPRKDSNADVADQNLDPDWDETGLGEDYDSDVEEANPSSREDFPVENPKTATAISTKKRVDDDIPSSPLPLTVAESYQSAVNAENDGVDGASRREVRDDGATADAGVAAPSNVDLLPRAELEALGKIPSSSPKKVKKRKLLNLPRGSYFKNANGESPPKQKKTITRVSEADKRPCPICKKANYGNSTLRTHIKNRHPGVLSAAEEAEEARKEIAERTCNICNKTMTTKGGYKLHMREIHLRDSLEDRTCPVCGKVGWLVAFTWC